MLCSHTLIGFIRWEAFRNDSAIPEVATPASVKAVVQPDPCKKSPMVLHRAISMQAKLRAVPPHKTQANATELLLQVQKEVDQKWSLVSVEFITGGSTGVGDRDA